MPGTGMSLPGFVMPGYDEFVGANSLQFRSSVQACAMRICQLNPDGSPQTGPNLCWCNSAFATFGVKATIEGGDSASLHADSGEIQLLSRSMDSIRLYEIGLVVLYPDPELDNLALGTPLLVDGLMTTGEQATSLGDPNFPAPVSVELWTKAVVGAMPFPGAPWLRWLFPQVYLRPADREFANAPQVFAAEGFAVENPSYGTGPFNDWRVGETGSGAPYDSSRAWQYLFSDKLPSNLFPGFQPIP